MVLPVTDDGARRVQVYIPSSKWYDYYTDSLLPIQGQNTILQVPLEMIPILLRGGSIIPTERYANNTKYSRINPFNLIIILDENKNAKGDLFYDDGETIDTIEQNLYFYAKYQWSSQQYQLKINVLHNNYQQMTNLILDSLSIYGLNQTPSNININGRQLSSMIRSQTHYKSYWRGGRE